MRARVGTMLDRLLRRDYEVIVERGSEGPKHDPYSYSEVEVRCRDGRFAIYHGGLGEWLRYGTREEVTHTTTQPYEKFALHVGVTPDEAEEATYAPQPLTLRQWLRVAQQFPSRWVRAVRAYHEVYEGWERDGCLHEQYLANHDGQPDGGEFPAGAKTWSAEQWREYEEVLVARAARKAALCALLGHDILDQSWCTGESGGDAGSCRRCGWSFSHTYY